MANFTSISVTTGGGASGSLIFSWAEYQAYSDEEYKANPKVNFDMKIIKSGNFPYEESKSDSVVTNGRSAYNYRAAISIEDVYTRGVVFVYNDPYLNLGGIGSFSEDAGHAVLDWSDIQFTHYPNVSTLPTFANSYTNAYCTDLHYWKLETNIPIFLTNAEAAQYIQYGDNIQNAINNQVPSVEGRKFEIINIWTEGYPILMHIA